ncbi:integral membrane protein PTH11 [Fusarium phyllophilum]|uniref:Integral membrane protein PTH11 n=1 Tax=Fusarium phyllophilum TaxID=47803 RepID=A0A8H5K098_9HYPO|nr:integral membrane protein PTH11 [Fusarium phyllophilum]
MVQLVSSIIFGILSTIVIFLRAQIRFRDKVFGVDDALMTAGYVLFSCLVGISCQATYYGMGIHDNELPDEIQPHGKQFVWLFQIFYCAALVFIKASICTTLLRIAVVPIHRIIAWATLTMSICAALIVFISLFVLCRPLPATWTGEGTCASPSALAILSYFVSAASLVTDLVCAILPGFMLYKAQMKTATKISISLVLGMGALTIYVPLTPRSIQLTQITDRVCNVALWCLFETGIGIVAGCLPPLRKLLYRWVKFDSSHGHSSGATPYGKGSTLGVTTKVGTTSRKPRIPTTGGISTGGEWERLDDDSSKRRIHVTVDMEMHTLENGASSVGSQDSIEELARPIR